MFKVIFSFLKKNFVKVAVCFVFVVLLVIGVSCITNKVSNSNSVSSSDSLTKHFYYGTPSQVLYE